MRRAAAPEELAAAILFLTAAESSFVTGITLPVDGGRSSTNQARVRNNLKLSGGMNHAVIKTSPSSSDWWDGNTGIRVQYVSE